MRIYLYLFICLFLIFLQLSSSIAADKDYISVRQDVQTKLYNVWQPISSENGNWTLLRVVIYEPDLFNYREIIGSSDDQTFNKSVIESFDKIDKAIFIPNDNTNDVDLKQTFFLFYNSNETYKILDFTSYFDDIINQHKKDPILKVYSKPAFAEVKLKINKNGSITEREIYNSSNDYYFNKLIFDFIDKRLILKPLPDDFNSNNLTFYIAFSVKQSLINRTMLINNLQAKIKKNWNPGKVQKEDYAKIFFRVDREGNLINQKIVESSGKNVFDKAAILTLENSSPFGILSQPDEPPDYKDCMFSFGYSDKNNLNHEVQKFVASYTKNEQKTLNIYTKKQIQKINLNLKYNNKFLSGPKIAIVRFVINKQGEIDDCIIEQSSKTKLFDASVIKAVHNTKFDPLPSFIKEDQIYLHMPISSSNKNNLAISFGLLIMDLGLLFML